MTQFYGSLNAMISAQAAKEKLFSLIKSPHPTPIYFSVLLGVMVALPMAICTGLLGISQGDEEETHLGMREIIFSIVLVNTFYCDVWRGTHYRKLLLLVKKPLDERKY